MGGTVSVIIKDKNNQVHKMHRWTNSLPHFIQHFETSNQNPQVLKNYLTTWEEMSEDYNKNKKTGKFKLNMTSVYVPDSGFVAPYEYGIVTVDLVKNKIMSLQGYSSLNKISVVNVCNLILQLKYNKNAQDDLDYYQSLMDDNKLELWSYETDKKVSDKKIVKELINKNFIENLSKIKAKDPVKFDEITSFLYFKIKFSNLDLIHYPETGKGMKRIYKDVQKDFKLSPADHKKWKEFMNPKD